MKKTELQAVPDQPKTLAEKIVAMKKELENFLANANREVAFREGKIAAYEEVQKSQKEAQPDAD